MAKTAIIIERMDIRLGGAERSVSELAAELRRQGIDAWILAASGHPSEYVRILCNTARRKRTSLAAIDKALTEHLRQQPYDIIHSVLPLDRADIYQPRGGSFRETIIRSADSFPNPLMRLCKQLSHWTNLNRTRMLWAERRLCRPGQKTMVAALSEYVRRQFIEHYGLDASRITVIPNGVNGRPAADAQKAAAFRQSILNQAVISNKNQAAIFLFAANNFRLKGLLPLLDAISAAMLANPHCPAVLAVCGSDNPKPYIAAVNRIGIGNRVVFAGAQESIHTALAAADAVVLPTWYDPCSRFILEALAAGKPVITTRLNGACERYTHLRHGWIIDRPDNRAALSNAIGDLCDAAVRQRFAEAIVQDQLAAGVCISRHVDAIIELYKTLLAHKKG